MAFNTQIFVIYLLAAVIIDCWGFNLFIAKQKGARGLSTNITFHSVRFFRAISHFDFFIIISAGMELELSRFTDDRWMDD
jgi:hypothetical protein